MDPIRVEGESMGPFLRPGDELGVRWFSDSEREALPGDIVIAREPIAGSSPVWIIHRVICRKGSRFWTQGDAALAREEMEAHELWGKIEEIGGRPFRAGPLDRLIARLSLHALPPEKTLARVYRRLARALGWSRRQFL